jgi:hypothetical protein
MNNLLKIKSVLSILAPMVFKFFCIFIIKKNTFQGPACFYENTYQFWRFYRKPHKNSPSPRNKTGVNSKGFVNLNSSINSQ